MWSLERQNPEYWWDLNDLDSFQVHSLESSFPAVNSGVRKKGGSAWPLTFLAPFPVSFFWLVVLKGSPLPEASVSLGNLEMQILPSHPVSSGLGTLGVNAQCVLYQTLQMVLTHVHVWKPLPLSPLSVHVFFIVFSYLTLPFQLNILI